MVGIDEVINIRKRNKIKLHLSDCFKGFLINSNIKSSDILLNFKDDVNICYVDVSDRYGYVKVLPSSKYLYILKKYKNDMKYDDDWYGQMKNRFIDFYKSGYMSEYIDKSIQYMKFGKFIRKVFKFDPLDVESFVIVYKRYQDKNGVIKGI